MSVARRLGAYARLVRLARPAGWLLLLWPTLWAAWTAADGAPGWAGLALFTGGAFLTRCFGCCVNDIADRDLDRQVERTRTRPLAAGEITVVEAAAVAGVCLAGCAALWWALAPPARWWALAAVAVAVTYPLAKRVIRVPQLHLAVAFGMGIPVAHAHFTGAVPLAAWVLFAANWWWVLAFDTTYAMADRAGDLRAGNNSAAVWLGPHDVLAVALCYFLALATLLGHGVLVGAGLAFYASCAFGFAYAYRLVRLMRTRQPAACMRSFTASHWLGALILLGLVADSRALS